jgi:hypothetical protein
VASFVGESFIAVFRDLSEIGPDLDQAAIRGRAIYPDYRVQDGEIGALCDQGGSCNSGLGCFQTEPGMRCIASCTGPGAPCPHGGKCQELSAGGSFCDYRP